MPPRGLHLPEVALALGEEGVAQPRLVHHHMQAVRLGPVIVDLEGFALGGHAKSESRLA